MNAACTGQLLKPKCFFAALLGAHVHMHSRPYKHACKHFYTLSNMHTKTHAYKDACANSYVHAHVYTMPAKRAQMHTASSCSCNMHAASSACLVCRDRFRAIAVITNFVQVVVLLVMLCSTIATNAKPIAAGRCWYEHTTNFFSE